MDHVTKLLGDARYEIDNMDQKRYFSEDIGKLAADVASVLDKLHRAVTELAERRE